MKQQYTIQNDELVYQGWAKLRKIQYRLDAPGSEPIETVGELFDCGHGVAVLAYHPHKRTVLLVKQFRLAAAMEDRSGGMLIEVCAGKTGRKSPEEAIRAELLEELGYKIGPLQQVISVYASPGAVSERLDLFIAACDDSMKVSDGGGLPEEHERVEILEIGFDQALQWIGDGTICDAKTILLLQYAQLKGLM